MQTLAIIERTAHEPLHRRSSSELVSQPISSMSLWTDKIWRFDHQAPGRSAQSVLLNWDYLLPDGRTLLDKRYHLLLDSLRRFAWSLVAEPCGNYAALAPTTLCALGSGIKSLTRWMVANGHSRLSELDRERLDVFKEDLPRILAGVTGVPVFDEEDFESDEYELSGQASLLSGDITLCRAFNHLRLPCLIWRQRDALLPSGTDVISIDPWDAAEVAAAVAEKAEGQILPIPAEVAVPVLNQAYRLIGTPAEDVITLLRDCVAAYRRGGPGGFGKAKGQGRGPRLKQAARKISEFRFSTIVGESKPWRCPLGQGGLTSGWTERLLNNSVHHELRMITSDIRNAAVAVLQGTAGLRASELLSIPGGNNESSGLPHCIEVQPALSGLYEIFVLKTKLSKMEEQPRDDEWVIGMRLAGSIDIPPAVRAIKVLQALLDPFRNLLGAEAPLLVWFKRGHGLARSSETIGPMDHTALSHGQKDFLFRNVDLSSLPDTSSRAIEEDDLVRYRESRGRCIRPHQWRKTLAHFVFNVDNRLIPALAMQFKHISIAMTSDHYLGRNQAIFQGLDSARAQETSMLLFRMATGKALVAGRMGNQLNEHISSISELIRDLPPSKAWERTLSLVIDKRLRIWFAAHGGCLPLKPDNMRCHKEAGTAHWLNKEPNPQTRRPSTCAGCACFVMDERHTDFWKSRYLDNWLSWKEAERSGRAGEFRVVRERATQAKNLLVQLGVDVTELVETSHSARAC